MPHLPPTSRWSVRAVAMVAAAVGVGLLLTGLSGPTSAPALRVTEAGSESTWPVTDPAHSRNRAADRARPGHGHRDTGMEDLVTGPMLSSADPVSVAIPRLRLAAQLESLGVDGAGTMEVPDDPAKAGWYHPGPPPGALGPAVIAGHVTWNQVPAVFFDLAALRPGDVVQVTRRDDRVAVFEVTHVRRYKKSEFPTQAVFGPIDHAGLRLITCGGEYLSETHRYTDNVVAFARLASSYRLGSEAR